MITSAGFCVNSGRVELPSAGQAQGRTLILGLGNDILTDDAVGLFAARELAAQFAGHPSVEVCETLEMGLSLLDFMVGFDRVVLVDSIQTGTVPAGTVHEVDASGMRELTGRTPHFLGVGETLALGRRLELQMPTEVTVLAVEVEDPYTLGTRLTPTVEASLPRVVERATALAVGSKESALSRAESA